jgi:oligoendopeptidase F
MAETASVFGEMLLNEMLLERSSSKEQKLSILSSQIEGIIATVFRQTVLTRFEQRAHKARENGRVSNEDLSRIWLEENQKLYGDSVKMIPAYKWGWAYIPHFVHTPFYCYAYSFGQLLVLALYHQYKNQGKSFCDGYINLLSSGGSDAPDRLIYRNTGLDINQSDFWMTAIAIIEKNVQQMENIL